MSGSSSSPASRSSQPASFGGLAGSTLARFLRSTLTSSASSSSSSSSSSSASARVSAWRVRKTSSATAWGLRVAVGRLAGRRDLELLAAGLAVLVVEAAAREVPRRFLMGLSVAFEASKGGSAAAFSSASWWTAGATLERAILVGFPAAFDGPASPERMKKNEKQKRGAGAMHRRARTDLRPEPACWWSWTEGRHQLWQC